MSNKELLDKLRDFIDKEFKQIAIGDKPLSTQVGACYTVSKVAVEILKRIGYNCRVQRVTVIVGNKKGRELFVEHNKRGIFDKDEIIRNEGWIIGIGVSPQFHYLIYFPDDDEVMDLTYGQANRPQYDLIAEHYWAKLDSLPETIILLNLIDQENVPKDFNPLYRYSEYRNLFKKCIKKGVKELRKYARS